MLSLERDLCPMEACGEYAEVLADVSAYDPDRGCPTPWDRGESWEAIEILEIDGQSVGEDWSFMCACGEPCDIRTVQAKVAGYLNSRDMT